MMFGSRRLAKRSIVGSRVSAPWQDGRYYPGVIQSTVPAPNGVSNADFYTILFDDGRSKTMLDSDIIGPGFQTIGNSRLKTGQRVFLTLNGREVSGAVVKHDWARDEVRVAVDQIPQLQVSRRLDDLRLLESRKSARLQDQDTDYSRLADMHPEPKKRAVSHVIDVPAAKSRRRKSSPEIEENQIGSVDQDSNDSEDGDHEMMDVMDEHMAAMVLTTLSCSPVSPNFPTSFSDKVPPSPVASGSSVASSGVFMVKSEPSTPSPPQVMSQSAPPAPVFGSPDPDEGIELDDSSAYFSQESGVKKRRSTRTVYKCTWPGCGKIHNTVSIIEEHVRSAHLGPKEEGGDYDMSDHEEEFYYTEIEVTVDTVTETFADMYTSSPPIPNYMEASRSMMDHDYQKKDCRSLPQTIPTIKRDEVVSHQGASYPLTIPVSIPQLSRSLSWQSSGPQLSPTGVKNGKFGDRLQQHQAASPKTHLLSSSPKSSPMHKKSRSEVKKCRKVYGMENRDMWCTQCKWKKACSRFMD